MSNKQSYTKARLANMADDLKGLLMPEIPEDFDWWDALGVVLTTPDKVQLREGYTPDWETLIDYATDWITCACGSQCDIIPREKDGCPKDAELRKLGLAFAGNVVDRDVKCAARTLLAIEQRSAELIKAIEWNDKVGKTFDHLE